MVGTSTGQVTPLDLRWPIYGIDYWQITTCPCPAELCHNCQCGKSMGCIVLDNYDVTSEFVPGTYSLIEGEGGIKLFSCPLPSLHHNLSNNLHFTNGYSSLWLKDPYQPLQSNFHRDENTEITRSGMYCSFLRVHTGNFCPNDGMPIAYSVCAGPHDVATLYFWSYQQWPGLRACQSLLEWA